ncbi:hypothetical protein FKN01_22245 [Streptomyces sp. 130]|uniref:hypothetical protein n=1 Tax=Streptomyces sp. 130 TaxID=2591006 RepID=UPI00117FA9D0|nr:hypothetical protein [Streptomyces sp. 130]TRV75150.1 hypothetical protein FKN01_22245 [Streptomyces sp. 130]
MYETGSWTFHVVAGGWTKCVGNDDRTAYLRLKPSERDPARLVTCATFMESNRPISSATWAQVPFATIERMAEDRAMDLVAAGAGQSTAIEDLERHFKEQIAAGRVQRFTFSEHTPYVPEPVEQPSTPLVRPQRITDDFLKDVAAQYRWLAHINEAPGPAIAEQTGAPVRTVQGWILRARKRGFLPPGRPGRAG